MEYEVSFAYSKQPVVGLYPQPDTPSPPSSLKINFNIVPQVTIIAWQYVNGTFIFFSSLLNLLHTPIRKVWLTHQSNKG